MKLTYDVLQKNIKKFTKLHGKVETIYLPKDPDKVLIEKDTDLLLKNNIDDFYVALLRPLDRLEYGIYDEYIDEDDKWSALEVILNNCWLVGDDELKTNEDCFQRLTNTLDIFMNFLNHIPVLPSITDREKLIVYMRKVGEKEIKSLEEINETDFHKFSFKKANRNDLRSIHKTRGNSFQKEEQLIYSLLVDGDVNLIEMDDSILMTLMKGKIKEYLVNTKTAYLKKN